VKSLIALVVGLIFFVGCGGGSSSNIEPTVDSNQLKIYKSGSPYADTIIDCVSPSSIFKECSLNRLPIISMETPNPTKEDILKRTIVSHKWMGDNFAVMLDYLPDDIKKLFGAVTAVVISYDVRPAFYNSATGAIYLDPRYLWFTPKEASDILKKEDFRSDFGKSLQFLPAWRYVKDGKLAIKYYSLDSNVTRTPDDIKLALARLLYHELAHANDYAYNAKNANKTLPLVKVLTPSLSNELKDKYPLQSQTLKDLAKVLYQGEPSTSYLDSLSASDVGDKFKDDGGTDLYNFYNREDVAMLFEESMMRYNFDTKRDVAFVKKDAPTYTVGWGERNRVSAPSVKDRAKFVTSALLPEIDWDDFFANRVGNPEELRRVGWRDSINIKSSKRFKSVDSVDYDYRGDFLSPEY
jgi:hypothetical protein